MKSVEYGAKQAIENCLKVKENEKLVIVTDKETLEIGNALKDAAEKITKTIKYYILEDFVENLEVTKCPEMILNAVKKADVSVYCASMKWYRWNSNSIVNDILKAVPDKKGVRHARMPGITKEIMETGMCADYSEIQRISRGVYDIVKDAEEIRVTTEKGTDLIARFSSKSNWTSRDGSFQERIENLPSGELTALPTHIEGYAVIDGFLGSYFNQKYKDLEKMPVELEIIKGKAVEGSVKCENKILEKEFRDYIFKTDKNSSRVSVFGLGTNIGLDKIIGNLLQDEKFPGVSIVFGSPSYFSLTKWKSKIVCDSLIKKTTFLVDGKKIMDKGIFLV